MARIIRNDSGDGWIALEGDNGIVYGCQTKKRNWWCRQSGIATVYDVGEIQHTPQSGMVPADVVALADVICPTRAK